MPIYLVFNFPLRKARRNNSVDHCTVLFPLEETLGFSTSMLYSGAGFTYFPYHVEYED